MTKQELLDHVSSYPEGEHYCIHVFCTEDVQMRADFIKQPVTRGQANTILDDMYHYQDSEYGMCWASMDEYIYDVIDKAQDELAILDEPIREAVTA